MDCIELQKRYQLCLQKKNNCKEEKDDIFRCYQDYDFRKRYLIDISTN